jgi:hypothetical protein
MLVIDLDSPHEGPDDIASRFPIDLVQSAPDQLGEDLQLVDDQMEGTLLLSSALQRSSFGLEFRHALAHTCNPGLELHLTDQSLGVTVDQSADAAPQLCELTFNGLQFRSVGPAADGL